MHSYSTRFSPILKAIRSRFMATTVFPATHRSSSKNPRAFRCSRMETTGDIVLQYAWFVFRPYDGAAPIISSPPPPKKKKKVYVFWSIFQSNIAWFIVDRLQRELDDTGDNVSAVHHDMLWNAEISAKCPAFVYFWPWLALAANLTGFCLSRVGGELQYPLFLTLLGFYFIFTRRVKLCNLRGM